MLEADEAEESIYRTIEIWEMFEDNEVETVKSLNTLFVSLVLKKIFVTEVRPWYRNRSIHFSVWINVSLSTIYISMKFLSQLSIDTYRDTYIITIASRILSPVIFLHWTALINNYLYVVGLLEGFAKTHNDYLRLNRDTRLIYLQFYKESNSPNYLNISQRYSSLCLEWSSSRLYTLDSKHRAGRLRIYLINKKSTKHDFAL